MGCRVGPLVVCAGLALTIAASTVCGANGGGEFLAAEGTTPTPTLGGVESATPETARPQAPTPGRVEPPTPQTPVPQSPTPGRVEPATPQTPVPQTPTPGAVEPATPQTPVPQTPEASRSGPTVTVGDVAFAVELARTPAQRTGGLSGREGMPPRTGMLFVYSRGGASAFWMKGMLFPLDFVWIGEDCTVVDVTSDVQPPAPGTPDSALATYRAAAPATYNLEINGGEARELGVQIGDPVSFSGFSTNGDGC